MIVLAIETSCDETSIAIVDGDRLIINRTYSQVKHHQQFVGVHPSIARRNHEERLPLLLQEVLKKSSYQLPHPNRSDTSYTTNATINHQPLSIEAIAVTVGPGLPPALETGIRFAKDLALQHNLPLIPVNHLEGHIASIFLKRKSGTLFVPQAKHLLPLNEFTETCNLKPVTYLSLIVSGGHTEIVHTTMNHQPSTINHQLIGQTLDDAAGEVIDKVGRELGLGYPAGPAVEAFAQQGNPQAHQFPLAMKNTPQSDLNFSFSGLKTKAIQMLHGRHNIGNYTERHFAELDTSDKLNQSLVSSRADLAPVQRQTVEGPRESRYGNKNMTSQQIYDFAASFQQAVINALIFKVKRSVNFHSNLLHPNLKTETLNLKPVLILSGGVSANLELRKQLRQTMKQLGGELIAAPKSFTGDNAAMIGLAAQWAAARGEIATTPAEIAVIDRQPNLNFPASPQFENSKIDN